MPLLSSNAAWKLRRALSDTAFDLKARSGRKVLILLAAAVVCILVSAAYMLIFRGPAPAPVRAATPADMVQGWNFNMAERPEFAHARFELIQDKPLRVRLVGKVASTEARASLDQFVQRLNIRDQCDVLVVVAPDAR